MTDPLSVEALAEALWAEQFPDAGPLSEQGPIATRIWTAKAERVMVYHRAALARLRGEQG